MVKAHSRAKDIILVRALMILRGIKPENLAHHAGVQLENLNAWLNGNHSTLAHRSYISVLSYLGITKDGLSGGHVQVWTLHAPRRFSPVQLAALKEISPWLVGGQIAEITGDYQAPFQKMRAYAIRGKTFKVIVQVTGKIRNPAVLDPAFMPNLQVRTSSDNTGGVCHVDPLYWHAVRSSAITPAEFDDIFTGNYKEWSWNDVRLVARERGITPSIMARWILSRDPRDSGALAQIDEALGGEVQVDIEPEHKVSDSDTPRNKSAKKIEKTLRAVPAIMR